MKPSTDYIAPNNQTTTFIGIDPGLNGAIAIYNPATSQLTIHDMPTFTLPKAGRKSPVTRELDLVTLALIIQSQANTAKGAVLERVSAMPGQGVSSMFKFGYNFGVAQATLASAMIPTALIPPQTWKRRFNILRSTKDISRYKATQIFPHHSAQWKLKKHDGRAEAALMAKYASEMDW